MRKMLNKAISIVPVLLVLLVTLIPTPASAASAHTYTDESGVTWTYTVEDSTSTTCTITKCSKTSGTISFPSEIEGKTVIILGGGSNIFNYSNNVTSVIIPDSVISIGASAFRSCERLASVTIGNSVTSIGDSAFYDCDSLTSVTIPDSVISIGASAFRSCGKLASVTIGNSVTSIGDSAFYDCDSLTSITIPDSVVSIGSSLFRDCGKLAFVTIGNSVTSIGNNAFYYCDSLTSITIPVSVTYIGKDAFGRCKSLTAINVNEGNTEYYSEDGVLFNYDITELINYPRAKTTTTYVIPDTVNSIAENAFSQCGYLKSVTIPGSVTTIGAYAFSWCYGITSITIPDSVISIEERTFLGCSELTSATIGNVANSIGASAFGSCVKLTSVTIGNSVTSIGNNAFYYCDSLTSITIPDSVISIGASAFRSCERLASVTIGNSVTSIGDNAFYNNTSLETVTIPDSVTSIDVTTFSGCSALTAINVDEGNAEYCSVDGILFNNDKTELFKYPAAKALTTYEIPNFVTTIKSYAFEGCSGLTSITIPDSVTSIGRYAFEGCSGLTSITIPGSVTSIEDYAFYGCTSLKSVYFTDDAPEIGDYAFYNVPTENFTIYYSDIAAGWDKYKAKYNTAIGLHIVTFDSNGGSTVNSQVVLSGEKATKPTDPTKTGLIFEGWYTDTGYTTPWDFNEGIIEASMTLYAKWPIETAVISISEITGVLMPVTGAVPDTIVGETAQYTATISWLPADATFKGSTVYTATITITPKPGYTLAGVPANFFTVAGAAATNAADSGAVTAVFPETVPIAYTVTFDVYGGSTVASISNAAFGSTITEPTAPAKPGYTFAGWYKEPTCTNEWDFASDVVSADITLYAKWIANTPASPSGDSNSGGSASPAPVAPISEIKNGESITGTNLDQLVSKGKNLTVKADSGAKLVFHTEALKGIDGQTSSAIKVEIKDITPEYQEIHSGKMVFSMTVYSESSTISNFGGKVTVFLPYELKEGEYAEDVTVWHLASDGSMSEIPCVYDPVTKLATFEVTHFSLYVVGVTEKPWGNPFSDVVESDWFYGAVEFVNRNGLFVGTGATTFSPSSPMTRAMLWTVLGRWDGQTLSGSGAFEKARIWAMGAGITDGNNPDGNITREQMVTILWRYAGSPRTGDDLSKFSDVGSLSNYAADAMAWAVENGVITGANGALMPQDNATRAQVAAIMQRFIEMPLLFKPENKPPDW
jgi:uncharacterized repeat protein (TIGR02543 family)